MGCDGEFKSHEEYSAELDLLPELVLICLQKVPCAIELTVDERGGLMDENMDQDGKIANHKLDQKLDY